MESGLLYPTSGMKDIDPLKTIRRWVELCSKHDLDFYAILKEAWNHKHSHQFGMLLIGFPIPQIVGEAPTEIHWQPLIFKDRKQHLKEFNAPRARRRSKRSIS